MNDSNDSSGASRRVCERLGLSRRAVLELDNGDILVGDTVDISLRGVLLQTDLLSGGDISGARGELFMIGEDDEHSSGFPCQVVRVKGGTVAVQLDRKAIAAFGQLINRELFRRSPES